MLINQALRIFYLLISVALTSDLDLLKRQDAGEFDLKDIQAV